MTLDTRTITYPLPGTIRSFVKEDNEFYTIVLNDALSDEEKFRAYQHEIEHIKNNDMDSPLSADVIEFNSHI